jgi:hypothetical protein
MPISLLKRRRKLRSLMAATCAAASIETGRSTLDSNQRADAMICSLTGDPPPRETDVSNGTFC